MPPKYVNQPNPEKPLYVTFIDEAKFERIQNAILKPAEYAIAILFVGIFGVLLLLVAGGLFFLL